MAEVTVIVAFIAGLASFLSPCVLPLIPGFLAYLSGTQISAQENGDKSGKKSQRLETFLNSAAFVLGFSVVFAFLGIILNTVLGAYSGSITTWLSRIGGLV